MKKKVLTIVLFITILINISFLTYYQLSHNRIKNNNIIINPAILQTDITEISLNDSFNDLDLKYKVSGNIDNTKVGNYILKYLFNNNQLNNYNLYNIISVKDNNAPTLTLKGKEKISLYVGEKYKEPGYSVIDDSNEDIEVIISGEINNKKVGKYTLTYSATDSSDNTSTLTRTIQIKNRPITTTRKPTTIDINDKGTSTNKNVNLKKNSNTTTSMKFTNKGIKINGYVKNGNGDYSIKLCSNNNCKTTKMTTKKTYYYSGTLNLTDLENGTYTMTLVTNNEMPVINELDTFERIVRTKINDKLVTVNYKNNKPTITIEPFSYQYDVLIDVGHGGDDNGATNSKIKEKDLNLTQSLYEKERFEQHGLKVLITRTDDTYGLMMASSKEAKIRRRSYAVGYYGVVSKIVYSNHHNAIGNDYYSGWELILTNQGSKDIYKTEYKIANDWKSAYPISEEHMRIYGRNYNNSKLLNKTNGATYNIKNYYAMQRIPYELYNIYTVTYEGCYLSNMDDFEWYIDNWKTMSEIKIKNYVESLGIEYIPN